MRGQLVRSKIFSPQFSKNPFHSISCRFVSIIFSRCKTNLKLTLSYKIKRKIFRMNVHSQTKDISKRIIACKNCPFRECLILHHKLFIAYSQLFSSFSAPSFNYRASVFCRHSCTKAVLVHSFRSARLKSSFHY